MTAPLPLRFDNTLKDMCKKVNLDYETVLGVGMSPEIRDAYLNAEIKKPLTGFNSKDKLLVRHKKEFYNNKYGNGSETLQGGVSQGEVRDKGRDRYDAGITVEHICADDSKVDEPKTIQDSKDAAGTCAYSGIKGGLRRAEVFVPGQGVVRKY
jgi:hypothetical protein